MLQIYWSGEAKISTKRGSIRAKWNGSWIGHTTKLWPSILCKILWYKIFILHNLVFIIDHRTPAQSNIQQKSFHQIGEILLPETSDKFLWMNEQCIIRGCCPSPVLFIRYHVKLSIPLALLFILKFRNNNLFQAINFYSSLTFPLFIFHILLLFLWSNV